MQEKGRFDKAHDNLNPSWVMVSIFAVIASILTVYHSLLIPDPLSIFYVIIISLLFTLAIIFVIFSTSKNINNLKYLSKSSIFLCVYILIIVWLGINKTIPEHEEILEFQTKRIELIYWNTKKEPGGTRALSLLYMRAKPAIARIEPNANHWGTKLMQVYLEDQINNGAELHYTDGRYSLADDMYELAEAIFIYSSRDTAHTWYQRAYEYGRKDALERYSERMKYYR